MAQTDPADQWRKSSYSLANGDCVEITEFGDRVAIRNSKHPTGPILTFPLARWQEFLEAVKRGDLDRQ